jgi:perosamine synthetase
LSELLSSPGGQPVEAVTKKPVMAPMPAEPIPLAIPNLNQADADAVMRCVQSGWVSTLSPEVHQFERAFGAFVGTDHTLALNSGTSALHLALKVAGVGPGDKVAVPALTFIASVNPVHYLGGQALLVDVCPHTFAMDATALANTLQAHPDVKAIVVTHLYGHVADMPALLAVAKGRPVIEDASEALGSQLGSQVAGKTAGKYAGTWGQFGCYSFNGNKTMTTGAGGMLIAQSPEALAHARHLAMQAKHPDSVEFEHTETGYNYRMSGLQAALGLSQLKRLPDFIACKRHFSRAYAEGFATLLKAQHTTPPPLTDKAFAHLLAQPQSVIWLNTLLCRDNAQQQRVMAKLHQQQIACRHFFKPLPTLPMFAQTVSTTLNPEEAYPVAYDLWQRGLCLPSSTQMTDEALQRVIQVIGQAL